MQMIVSPMSIVSEVVGVSVGEVVGVSVVGVSVDGVVGVSVDGGVISHPISSQHSCSTDSSLPVNMKPKIVELDVKCIRT